MLQQTKKIEDLAKGDVWSINAKSRKMALLNLNPQGNIVAHEVINNAPTTVEIQLPYVDYQGRDVLVWANIAPKPKTEFSFGQRVSMSGMKGMIIDDMKVAARVLWDEPTTNGNWVTAETHESLETTNEVATSQMLERGKEARALARDLETMPESEDTKRAQEEATKQLAARETYKGTLDAQFVKDVQSITQKTIDTYAKEINVMVEAGVIALTAGPEEGQIDRIPELVDTNLENIAMKVATITNVEDFKIPATVSITHKMATTMLDRYFLTRHAFIRTNSHNRWLVFSDQNDQLGVHANNKGAVRQLHAVEYKHRHGLI